MTIYSSQQIAGPHFAKAKLLVYYYHLLVSTNCGPAYCETMCPLILGPRSAETHPTICGSYIISIALYILIFTSLRKLQKNFAAKCGPRFAEPCLRKLRAHVLQKDVPQFVEVILLI